MASSGMDWPKEIVADLMIPPQISHEGGSPASERRARTQPRS
jgi:hypothetical protein